MSSNHQMPQDIDAECAILGAMLRGDFGLERATDAGLTAQMFAWPAHQTIYTAIVKRSEQGPVDTLTVVNELKAMGKLGEVGGSAAVMTLDDRVPTIANAKAYAEAVVEASVLRSLVQIGERISALGYERPAPINELIIDAGQIVDELNTADTRGEAGLITLRTAFGLMFDEMLERSERGSEIAGHSTGLQVLDERWGGLQGSKLYVIAGRPGMGKSALAAGIAEALALGSDVDVYCPNLEMGATEQAGRALARIGRLNLGRITNGKPTQADFDLAGKTMSEVGEAADRIHLDAASDLTAAQIRQRARKLDRELRKKGRRLGCVVVDYLQRVQPPRGMSLNNETAVVNANSKAFANMANEFDIPVVVLSQLNRAVEERPDKKPKLSDLRQSGAIEEDADVVALLYRPEYYLKAETPAEWIGMAQIETAKWRGGQPGTDLVAFNGTYVRFSNNRPGMSTAVSL